MKKKIAKLESKIKSYDKVTVRKGTQTTEVFDKVVECISLFTDIHIVVR